jgi:hypothetical protein
MIEPETKNETERKPSLTERVPRLRQPERERFGLG